MISTLGLHLLHLCMNGVNNHMRRFRIAHVAVVVYVASITTQSGSLRRPRRREPAQNAAGDGGFERDLAL